MNVWAQRQLGREQLVQSQPTKVEVTKTVEISTDEDDDFLIDIGANLTHKRFSPDFDDIIQRSLDFKVNKIVITGTSLSSSQKAVEICKFYPGMLYSTAGIHPHDAKSASHHSLLAISKVASENPDYVKAIGECGLDFDRNFSTPEQQVLAFRAQLQIAVDMKLPVFLHERSAYEKFVEILREYRPKLVGAVVHCFTGTKEELQAYLDLDLHIGITGWINDERRGLELRKLVGMIPLDRLMIETDAPFLTPRDMKAVPKDNRNEPCFLPHVLRAVAKARNCSAEEVSKASTRTAKKFFRL